MSFRHYIGFDDQKLLAFDAHDYEAIILSGADDLKNLARRNRYGGVMIIPKSEGD